MKRGPEALLHWLSHRESLVRRFVIAEAIGEPRFRHRWRPPKIEPRRFGNPSRPPGPPKPPETPE